MKHMGRHFDASCANWKCKGIQGALMHLDEKTALAAWNRRAAASAQAVPDGYKLVPADPTEEMLAAAYSCPGTTEDGMRKQWRAMLAAAPDVPASDSDVRRKALTEEEITQIESALDMLLSAMRAANWEGDDAYLAGEKARALLREAGSR